MTMMTMKLGALLGLLMVLGGCDAGAPANPGPDAAGTAGTADLGTTDPGPQADLGAPSPDQASPTPTTVYAPYVYLWGLGNGAYPFKTLVELSQRSGLAAVTLAFVVSPGGCSADTATIDANLAGDFKDYQARGGRIRVSFGGANGTYVESDRACATNDNLYTLLADFVRRTSIRDLDFDVEQAAEMTDPVNKRRGAALARLQQTFPGLKVSLTLPSLPRDKNGTAGGMTTAGLAVVRAAVAAGVDVSAVNLMTMDFGPYFSTGRTMGDLSVSAVNDALVQLRGVYPQATDAALYARLGVTPMIGVNDVTTEIFQKTDATTVTTFARDKKLGLVSFWAINRDQPCPYDNLGVCSKVNASAFEFHQIFKALP